MTREEAVYELERMKTWSADLSDDEIEALVLALKALAQEPCDDAISRQAVLDQTYLWSKDEFLRVTNPFDHLRKRINSLPSVTPQQRTGRWKFTVYDANRIGHYECSECHWNVLMNVSDYCPHCGAKMEVQE